MKKAIKNIRSEQSVKDVISKGLEILFWAIMVLLAVSMIVLPCYMILTAFKKDNLECVMNPFGLPKQFNFDNFPIIFLIMSEKLSYSIGSMVWVSIFTSIFRPFMSLFFTTMFAYVIAKYKFIGGKFWYNLGIVVMIIPIVGNTASQMQVFKATGVYNNVFMYVMHSATGGFYGSNFLLLYAAFKGMSWNYAEAAFIDGANDYTVLFKIYFPMVVPTFLSLFVLSFMSTWNDYATYKIWLPDHPNLAYGMYIFNLRANSLRVSLPQLMAGFTVVMIPTVVLYFITHNLITSKVFVGGLKG